MKLTKRFLVSLAAFAAIYIVIAWVRGIDPFAFGGPVAGVLAILVFVLPFVLITDLVRRWRARGRAQA